jgi:hypothetical protein
MIKLEELKEKLKEEEDFLRSERSGYYNSYTEDDMYDFSKRILFTESLCENLRKQIKEIENENS